MAGVQGGTGRQLTVAAVGAVVLCAVGGAVLQNGLPFGVVALGLVLGALSSLTAMGLVIVYRSARIINFAQAEIGALAATVTVIAVAGSHWPYAAALPLGLTVAVATGALVDTALMRRLFEAPRLIVTVMTIGLAQVLGAAELALPSAVGHLRPFTTFTTPFTVHATIGPIVFTGNHLVAVVAVPLCLAGLGWFFGATDAGIAIRGAADSADRATLLGIPVRRLSMVTWMVAAGLSGVASMLSAPILGPQIGQIAGPQALLAPLAAAVIGGMESLSVAFAAALAIGVFQQAVFWSYPRSSTVDVVLFGLVLAALLAQRRKVTRTDDPGLGGFVALREVRPVPEALRRLPEVRAARLVGGIVVAVAAVVVPLAASDSGRTTFAYVAIFGILATSLVVLTGWSGQISLGQFAFVGIGAGVTASLLVHARLDLFAALAVATIGTGAAAVLVGLPALRVPGLLLSVVTLAFAVPVSTFLLSSTNVPILSPAIVPRPVLLGRFPLDTPRTFYYLCVAFLVLSIVLARNFRGSRIGRIVIAVRDNDRGAASFSIRPVRAKLTAFAVSGGLAGLAGGLYVVGLRGIAFSGFQPEASLQVFTMVVVGGLGSLFGAVLGAAFVQSAQYFLHGAVSLLATGAGLLLVIELLPAGLASLVYRARDRLLRALVNRQDTAGRGPDASDHAGEAGVCDPRTDWDLGPNLDGQDVPGAIPVAVGVESTGR